MRGGQLLCGEPAELVVLVRGLVLRGSRPDAHVPHIQRKVALHSAAREVNLLRTVSHANHDPQLLAQLAFKRSPAGLASLDVAAREVPHTRKRGTRRGPIPEKHLTVGDQCTGDYMNSHTTDPRATDRSLPPTLLINASDQGDAT
jgi:hypothetical protein